MENKMQKIRKEVEKLKSNLIHGACSSQVVMETRCKEEAYNEVLDILDSSQEESVSSIWHDASEPPIIDKTFLLVAPNGNSSLCLWGGKQLHSVTIGGGHSVLCKGDIYSYIDDLLNLSNVQRTVKNWKEPVSEDLEEAASRYAKEEYSRKNPATLPDRCRGCYAPLMYAFKAGAQWQEAKDEFTTEDLGEYINKLSKQFPEVSFAKLSRIAVRVAKWQKEQMKNTLEPDTPATAEEIKSMQDKRRYELQKKVQHEYNSQLQKEYDNGYDDGYKDAEKVAYEKVKQLVRYQLDLRLPETLDYNGVQVDREDFINDFIKAMNDE